MKPKYFLLIITALFLGAGCDKDENNAPFKALFNFSVSGFSTNFFNFTDFRNYTGPYAEYAWDFGDGETSTEASPSHIYAAIGEYDVTLTATKGGQTSTFTDKVAIKGPEIKIEGDFTDWDHIDFSYTNDDGDAVLKRVKIFESGGNINFYVEGSGDMDFSEVQVYFNTDDNPGTGYQLSDFPAGSGAEFNFYGEGLNVYTEVNEHQGEPEDDDWENIFYFDAFDDETSAEGGPTYSSVEGLPDGSKAIEFAFPKSLLGGVSNSISFAIYDYSSDGVIPAAGDPSSQFIRVEF
ncbi:MAG: PKD domain-containing protein [Chitinophagaceae bacterium]|nr:PKD domain-containing protein [Chitinophagaceae bacterium]